jgi:hypothetical protein
MEKQFRLPGISCDFCNAGLYLIMKTKWFKMESVKLFCRGCYFKHDLLEETGTTIEGAKTRAKKILEETGITIEEAIEKAKHLAKKLSKTLVELKPTIPRDKEHLKDVIKNPKHPFTAALLAGLLIILMELSGFGIFVAVTWILGNLILNPFGWFLVPIIVAVAFAFRNYFKKENLKKFKNEFNNLEKKRDCGEMSTEQFDTEKNRIIEQFFTQQT